MAKNNTMTTVSIGIDAQRAVRRLEELKERVDSLTNKLSELAAKSKDPSTWGPTDTESSIGAQFKKTQKDLEKTSRDFEFTVRRVAGIDDMLKEISTSNYNTLTQLRTTLTNSLKNRKLETEDQIKAYEEAAQRLQKVRDEIAKRDIDVRGGMTSQKAGEVMGSVGDYSVTEIKQAVEVTTKLRDMQQAGSEEWKRYNAQIEAAKKYLDDYNASVKKSAMENQFKQLTTLSKNALEEQQKYWQSVLDNAGKGTAAYIQAERKLQAISAEMTNRESTQAGKVMSNLGDYSVSEIEAAIKATEKLRDAQKAGSAEYAIYAEEIKRAKEYLQGYVDLDKQIDMEDKWSRLPQLSANALAEQKKYWQEMVAGAANGSKELAEYQAKLKEVVEEERKRTAASVKDVMTSPTTHSVAEIKEAIKATEQLRDAQIPGTKKWKEYAAQIGEANAVLDKFNNKAKVEAMSTQFGRLTTLSKTALSEQKKFWQTMADGAEQGSNALRVYERNLKNVIQEEQKRTQQAGKEMMNQVLSGSWSGTIAESKEAIKLLKEYKDTLSTTNTTGIKNVDKAISELTNKTRIAETGFRTTSEALNRLVKQTKNLGSGNFKGSIAELEEMRRKLITIRDTQDKVLSAKDRDRLTKALQRVDKELAIVKGDAIDINHVLGNLKDTPLKTLERAAAQLQSEIRDCSEATGDFAAKAAQLRRVNAQVDKLKKTFKEKEGVISRTAKRLAAYVAIYGGFNFVIGKIKEMINANLQLSDTFADVRKTTQLSVDEMNELSKSINSIDTRTSQQQLHELAAVAGQLGLRSQTDILGFVKASNMISVSLNELGAEGTSSLMKIATLTGEASMGTEKALLSIGSAINELTAASAATAGPIVDLMNRMGGVAAQAGLTSAQMAAIGATANALGQSIEVTGTSMNKFVTTLMSDSDQIAYALNMDAKALRDMLDSGKTMDAMIAVFEKMNSIGGLSKMAGIMGDLGSEGARMTQVLSAMASQVEFLKVQVDLSNEAYANADSIQKEYNIKNENALAIWQRIGNMLKEVFVNNVFVDILTTISRGIHNVLSVIIEGEYFFKILASSIAAVTAALYANSAAWVANYNAMGFKAGIEAMLSSLNSKLGTLWNTIRGGTTGLLSSAKAAWAAAAGTNAFKKACDLAQTSLKKLSGFLSRNWLTITIAAIASLVAWLVTAATRVSELTRATARYHREVEEERNKVDALFSSLNRLNNTEEDRARIIAQINREYSSYLGFMLSEHDSAEKLAAAHKLINAELEKRMALNLQSTLEGTAANEYAESYEKAATSVESVVKGEGLFNSEKYKGKVQAGEVNALISRLVNEAVTAAIDNSGEYRKLGKIDMDAFMASVEEEFGKKFDYKITTNTGKEATVRQGKQLFGDVKGSIEDMLDARIEYMESIFDAERAADVEMGRIAKDSVTAREEMLKTTEAQIKKLEKEDVSKLSEEDSVKHYAKLLDNVKGYVDNANKVLKEIPESERSINDTILKEKIKTYEAIGKKVAPLAGVDYWGKNQDVSDWKQFADIVTNLDTSSANALVAAYKKITEDTAKIPSNVKAFYKMFEGTGLETKLNLQSPTDVAKQVYSWAEQIKDKLKTKFGRNTSGAFIFDSEGDGSGDKSAKRKAKEDMQAAISAFEAYWNEYETYIKNIANEKNITQGELNRQLFQMEVTREKERVELYKALLGETNSFNKEMYIGMIAERDYFANKDLVALAAQLDKWGVALEDGLKNKLTQAMLKQEEYTLKQKEKIEKLLLEDNFTEQVAQQFLEAIDELGLLFGLYDGAIEDTTKEEGERRLAYMREWAKKAYSMTAAQLEDEIKANTLFSEWVIGRKAEDYEALLIQLRKFNDDQEEAERKAAERRKKIFDKSKRGREITQRGETKVRGEEADVEMLDRFRGLDIVSDNTVDRAQIEVYEAQIEASQAYIKQIGLEMMALKLKASQEIESAESVLAAKRKLGGDTTEAEAAVTAAKQRFQSLVRQEELITLEQEQNISEQRANILERYTAIEQQKVEEAKKYTDAMITFADSMTEADWDDVESRKEAAKTLVKTTLQTLRDWATIKLTELAMKQTFASQSNAIAGQEMLGEMTAKGAETTANVTLNSTKATANAVGKYGLKGLLIGAAISAALTALMNVAMKALFKSKSEVTAATGASTGRLATGMLTYAEGNYPVLGNDGQVYNAKYEGANIKTGIYGGGAHFGIFSEKKPEAIIDGDTTQRLIMNHPDIWQSIVTLSKYGRLNTGMRTFATGNINELARTVETVEADTATDSSAQMMQMQATIDNNNRVMAQLVSVLSGGIKASVDMYGNNGLYRSQKKAEKFARRSGMS